MPSHFYSQLIFFTEDRMDEKPKVNRKADKIISFRVDKDDYKLIKEKIEKSGVSQTEFLKNACLGIEIIDKTLLKKEASIKQVLNSNISVMGSNLNQIARKINSGALSINNDDKKNIFEIGKELKKLSDMLKESTHAEAESKPLQE